MIGVNSDADLEEIKKTVKEKEINWRSFWNGPQGYSGPISAKWNVANWPTSYIIDSKGVIRFKDLTDKKLDQAIEKLLSETEDSKKNEPKTTEPEKMG